MNFCLIKRGVKSLKTAIPVNEELLDKIDQVKLKFGIEFPSYRDVINRMCDILLEMNKVNSIKLEELKTTIEKTIKFLQEKVREDDYFYEEFFNDLVKIYDKINVCLRKN